MSRVLIGRCRMFRSLSHVSFSLADVACFVLCRMFRVLIEVLLNVDGVAAH